MSPHKIQSKDSTPHDLDVIERLYGAAFPDEDLFPLVRDLIHDPVVATSIVTAVDADIAGHALFSKCRVVDREINVSLLGPLAVFPTHQGKGIGSAIVRFGINRLYDMKVDAVCVLGDPAYYRRFGFLPERDIEPPFQLPPQYEGAWQSIRQHASGTQYSGKLLVPEPWNHAHYWSP